MCLVVPTAKTRWRRGEGGRGRGVVKRSLKLKGVWVNSGKKGGGGGGGEGEGDGEIFILKQ